MKAKGASITPLTVGEWYTRHSEALQLRLLGPAVGFDRVIREPTINRPGLALSGFFAYFAFKRIQVLGSAEHSYLKASPGRRSASAPGSFFPIPSPAWSFPGRQNRLPRSWRRPARRAWPYSGRR